MTGLLALLALAPVSVYLAESGQADPVSLGLTVLNVLLIAVLLFLLFGPAPAEQHHGNGAPQ